MRLLLPNSLGGKWRLGQWGSGHFVRLGHFCQAMTPMCKVTDTSLMKDVFITELFGGEKRH